MKKFVVIENGVVVEKNEGSVIEVEVSYDLGNGYNSSRGMKLSFYPTTISRTPWGYSYQMTLFDKRNKRFVCENLERKSKKKIEKWEKIVEENLLWLLTKYNDSCYDEIMNFLIENR